MVLITIRLSEPSASLDAIPPLKAPADKAGLVPTLPTAGAVATGGAPTDN